MEKKRNIFNCIIILSIFIAYGNSHAQSENKQINLYAFIGEKISVIEFNPNENNTKIEIDSISGDTIRIVNYSMDYAFKNKFKVIKNLFNKIETDTIEFVTFNHYGRPMYEKYKNVILYISFNKQKGEYYLQKYQFDPVRNTKKGIWKGLNGKTVNELFNKRKNGVLKARGLFNE